MKDFQFEVFNGTDMEGDNCIYVKINDRYPTDEQALFIATVISDALNGSSFSIEEQAMLLDDQEKGAETGGGLCDFCMRSGIEVAGTIGGKTYCSECEDSATESACCDCGKEIDLDGYDGRCGDCSGKARNSPSWPS